MDEQKAEGASETAPVATEARSVVPGPDVATTSAPAAAPAPVVPVIPTAVLPATPQRGNLSTTLGAHSIARVDTTGALESVVKSAVDGAVLFLRDQADVAEAKRLLVQHEKRSCMIQVNPRQPVQALWRTSHRKPSR